MSEADGILFGLNGRRFTIADPALRVILTVSPVPLIATATNTRVLAATVYSKSLLRVVAEEATSRYNNVSYFPAYEIATDPQAPEDFFELDRREPSQKAIDTIMSALLARCDVIKGDLGRSSASHDAPRLDLAVALSEGVVRAECEDAAAAL